MSYVTLDHTADIGFEIEAASLDELFETAAVAFCDAVTDPARVEPRERRRAALEAASREELLVEWLEELIYHLDTRSLVFSRARVELAESGDGPVELRAELAGEPFDPERHPHEVAIKGITYHHLRVWKESERWRARIIFDI